ncbi:MAG: hypothetical protein Kow0079_06190 [Vicingaceae bacterium]
MVLPPVLTVNEQSKINEKIIEQEIIEMKYVFFIKEMSFIEKWIIYFINLQLIEHKSSMYFIIVN